MFTYKEYPVSEHLQEYIACYWVYRQSEKDRETLLPDSYYELIVLDTPAYSFEGRRLPNAFVVAPLAEPLHLDVNEQVSQLCVRFYPWAFSIFGPTPEHSHIMSASGFSASLLAEMRTLVSNIQAVPESELMSKLDDLFSAIFVRKHFEDKTTQIALRALREHNGHISITELAKICHVTNKQLSRTLAHHNAPTSKQIAMRLQFESVRELLTHQPNRSLVSIAEECGYYDQAHLTTTFRRFSGMSPDEYRRLAQRLLRNSPKDVHFLQDRPSDQ